MILSENTFMDIFKYSSYKKYIKDYLNNLPKKGRGEFKIISELIQVHSTMLSHILNGKSNFTLDQAYLFAQYLNLNDLETEFFLTLIDLEKCSNFKLKDYLNEKLKKIQYQAKNLKNRVNKSSELNESQKAVYYSSTIFGMIRLLSNIPQFQNIKKIKSTLDLPDNEFNFALQFLIESGLVVKTGENIKPGLQNTVLSADSYLIWQHHRNWRIKGFERHGKKKGNECFITAPLTISESDSAIVREKIMSFISEISKISSNSNPEKMACINIDWFLLTN